MMTPACAGDPVTQSKRKSAVATREPRHLCWRAEQVCWASNALQTYNHPINSTTIRALFDANRVLVEDRGNQWIGDVLGGHGLHLPKDQKGNYVLPEGGIGPEDIIQWFLVSFDYQWDTDCEKYFPAAAALPPPQPKQPRKPKQPKQPSQDTQVLNELRATLCCAVEALQETVRLLREAPPLQDEAEASLQLAEQLLESLADEMQ
jgi:hypothetical protein